MTHLNIEIKARCKNQEPIRKYLQKAGADFRGVDHQVDTYFMVERGRLKLREGSIENDLIYYERDNQAGPKRARVTRTSVEPGSCMKDILTQVLKVLVVVDKKREIYFIDNVKFHIDDVADLGHFIEIEAQDLRGKVGQDKLLEQCQGYLHDFGIKKVDLVSGSYSDLLLKKQKKES